MAIFTTVDHRHFAVGRDFEDLALVARGQEQVACFVLDDIPNVSGVKAGERLELAREVQRAFVADDGAFELGLLVIRLTAVMPDFDFGGMGVRREENDRCQLVPYGLYALRHGHNNGLRFSRFRVPCENLLIPSTGDGLTIAYHGLNLGRVAFQSPAIPCVGQPKTVLASTAMRRWATSLRTLADV